MKKNILVSVALVTVLASLACSSSTTGGNIQSACNITGTYKIHYAVSAGSGATCTAIPDQTLDLTPKDAGSAGDAGTSACTPTTNAATCSMTYSCTTKAGGFTTTSSGSTTFAKDGSSGTGTSHSKMVNDADGSVLSDCGYDITYTRQ
jgi:hypothetical protein